jgi:hypothetical protein
MNLMKTMSIWVTMIDLQIKTYTIESSHWRHSVIADLARDADDIERRAVKGVNPKGERHRYALLCQRMQQTAAELAENASIVQWQPCEATHGPYALAFVAISSMLRRWAAKNPKLSGFHSHLRLGKIYTPPAIVAKNLEFFELLNKSSSFDQLIAGLVSTTVFVKISDIVNNTTSKEP